MANKRITELNAHTSPQLSDLIAIVNSNETKKIAYGTLYYGIRDGLVSGSSQIILGDTNGFTTFSGSIDTRLDNSLTTASLSSTVLTFEKGDTTTFDINLGDTFITPSQTGSLIESSYISLYSTQSQQLVESGSAQPVTFSNIWTQRGVSLVSGSQLVMEKAGTYQFNFVAQITNTENAVHDSYFWIKYNGSNFPNSATQMSLQPRKNESTPSAQLLTVNIVGVAQNDNDYIELYWTGDSDTIQLNETPSDGVKPETPSVIANIVRVG